MSEFISTVPPLSDPALELYLQARDTGVCTGTLSPVAIVQTSLGGGLELDVIGWAYQRDPNLAYENLEPDGFVIWWENASTNDPVQGGVLVSAQSRTYSMIWPSGVTRSYAVAAFRNTYQGEQQSLQVQAPSWKGAT